MRSEIRGIFMKILIISDLHFQEDNDWNRINSITHSMIQRVTNKMKKRDRILVVTLGDIINCGNATAFQQAKSFYMHMQQSFITSEFRFVPGNHDLVNNGLTEFNSFIKELCNQTEYTDEETVFAEDVQGVRMLYVDSTLNRDYNARGKINLDQIKAKMSNSKNLIFMHFPPCVQEKIDKNIPNSNELIATRLNYIFYGHQHGYVTVPDFLGKDTDIHAVGTLLKYDVSEHDFLLLDMTDNKINYAYRYTHNEVKFTPDILWPSKQNVQSDKIKTALPSALHVSFLKRKVKTIFEDKKVESSEALLWSHYIGTDLDEYFKENNLIVLCGDAGSGKTFELQHIHEKYKSDEEYFPIWVQLKSVSSDKLSEYIDYCKNTIDKKNPLFIFDGLDEMESCSINKFIVDISSAVVGDKEIKVIVSVRSALSRSIDGFVQCILVDINDDEIKQYAKSEGIDAEMFYSAICDSGCLGLARRPFYLVEMAKLFKNTNTLPKEIDLLERMINNRFYDSDKKHIDTLSQVGGLIENEALLHCTLSEISFFMQVRKEYLLSNYEYTYIWNLDIRNLLNRTGLLTASRHECIRLWEFEHNNFREYLCAKYLNQLSFDEIISTIVYDENRSKLRPSWINVVTYLLPMQNDNKLMDWLIANAKDALCNFESDKLTLTNRNEIFIAVMNDAISKQLLIIYLYDVNKLGRYFQSKDTISFMLEILKNSTNNYAVSNVLHVLRCCNNFYGKENELKTAILEKHLRNMEHEHIVELSIEVLERIFTTDLCKIVPQIFAVLCKDKRSHVFGSLCELLVKTEVVDNYIDDIIKASTSDDILVDYYAQRGFENVLSNVKSIEGVNSVMKLFCNNKLPYVIESKDGIVALNCKRAEELFFEGNDDILTIMIDCFIEMANKCDRRKCNHIKSFFSATQTLSVAFEAILNRKLRADSMMFTIEHIMDESLEDILIEKYLNCNMIDEAFKWYANRLPHNSVLFMKIDDAVLKKDGLRIQRDPQIDWNIERKLCNQKYFNCLFDKSLFSKLLDELLLYINNNDITCGQLVSNFSNEIYDFSAVPQNRHDLQNIRTAIYQSGLTEHKVTQFFDYINWETFCTREMCRMLELNRMDIEINEGQKEYIDNYLQNQMQIINFEDYPEDATKMNEVKYIFVHDLISFAVQVEFKFSDEKLLEMLVLPWYMFVSSTSTGESETLKFIVSRITEPKKLHKKILENIRGKKLAPLAAQTHILYCLENKILDAVDLAINLFCNDLDESKHRKNTAVDYLLLIKGNKFVDGLVSKITDQDLLRYLAHSMKTDNTKLINKLVDENKKSESQTLYLKELIELNNRYALETYLNLAKRANALPDQSDDNSHNGEITMSIRTINDISLIDIISALFEVSYAEDFADIEYFGLKGALDDVINKFTQTDAYRTKEMLANVIINHAENAKLISVCNWHLNNIEKTITASNDLPWELEETIAFLESHRSR